MQRVYSFCVGVCKAEEENRSFRTYQSQIWVYIDLFNIT